MHSVGLSQWRRGCQCEHPEAATCSGGREQRARPCRRFLVRGGGTKVRLEHTAPPWPSAAWPHACLGFAEDRAQPSAGLLPLISLEGQPVAMAIAGRVGGGNQGQLHLESEDWEGLAGRGVAASCTGSWRTGGCPGEVCVFVMPDLPRAASPPFPALWLPLCLAGGDPWGRVGMCPAGQQRVWAWKEVEDVHCAGGSARWGWERLEKPPFT